MPLHKAGKTAIGAFIQLCQRTCPQAPIAIRFSNDGIVWSQWEGFGEGMPRRSAYVQMAVFRDALWHTTMISTWEL